MQHQQQLAPARVDLERHQVCLDAVLSEQLQRSQELDGLLQRIFRPGQLVRYQLVQLGRLWVTVLVGVALLVFLFLVRLCGLGVLLLSLLLGGLALLVAQLFQLRRGQVFCKDLKVNTFHRQSTVQYLTSVELLFGRFSWQRFVK